MISASDARKNTEIARNKVINREIERKIIDREIKKASNDGYDNIALDYEISHQTIEYLYKLGYKVYTESRCNKTYLIIEW